MCVMSPSNSSGSTAGIPTAFLIHLAGGETAADYLWHLPQSKPPGSLRHRSDLQAAPTNVCLLGMNGPVADIA